MKHIRRVALALLVAASSTGHASADSSVDSCGAILCLAGDMLGQGGGEACAGYVAKYFSIVDWHHGHMDDGPTSRDRMSFLNQCPSQDQATKQAVNDRYGTQLDAP